MPTGKHLSRNTKITMVIGAIVFAVLGIMFLDRPAADEQLVGQQIEPVPFSPPPPTDTVIVGAIDAVGTGQGQGELFLVQKKGETVSNTKLILDEHSYCNVGSGGLPCMAMSVTFSTAFGGKRALVDGNKDGDAVRVRRLRIMPDEEIPRVMPAGTVYIPWMQARTLITSCTVRSLMQSHEGLVHITLKDGSNQTAVEPVIDEVFRVANEAGPACGNITIGTE